MTAVKLIRAFFPSTFRLGWRPPLFFSSALDRRLISLNKVAGLVVDCIVRVAPIAWRVRVLIAFISNLCPRERETERSGGSERVEWNSARADVVWRKFSHLRPGSGGRVTPRRFYGACKCSPLGFAGRFARECVRWTVPCYTVYELSFFRNPLTEIDLL